MGYNFKLNLILFVNIVKFVKFFFQDELSYLCVINTKK